MRHQGSVWRWGGPAVAALGLVGALAGTSRSANAQACDPAGARSSLVENGKLNLKLNFQYFPSAADVSNLKSQVLIAQQVLCDATDAQVKLNKVTVTVGQASESDGNIWLLPKTGRSYSNLLGAFATPPGHVSMMLEDGGYRGHTMAHELMHYLFGLGDSYREDIRWLSDGCGFGPNFDPGTLAREVNNTIMQDSGTVCRLTDPADGRSLGDLNPRWETPCDATSVFGCPNNCPGCTAVPNPPSVTSFFCDKTPLFASELSVASNFDQLTSSFASQAPDPNGSFCPAPKPGGFLAVSAAFPTDTTVRLPDPSCGNGVVEPAKGEECEAGSALPTCEEFGLSANSGSTVTCSGCVFDKSPCYAKPPSNLCAYTVGKPEACVADGAGNPSLPPGTTCATFGMGGGTPSCSLFGGCSVDLFSCTRAATCGNGVIDAGEQCDMGTDNGTGKPAVDTAGQPVTCERYFGAGAAPTLLTCNNNCTFSKSACKNDCDVVAGKKDACSPVAGGMTPPKTCQAAGFAAGTPTCQSCSLSLLTCVGAFDSSSWEAARKTSAKESQWFGTVDAQGSVHRFRLYARHLGNHTWEVHLLAEADHFVGGAHGVPAHVRTFHVTFDPSTHNVTSVASGNGAPVPGATGTVTLGGSDGNGEGTAAFVPSPRGQAPALTMTADLSKVQEANWLLPSDAIGSPRGTITFFGDTEVRASANATDFQAGFCGNQGWCQETWNTQTQRWEGSHHRYAQVFDNALATLRTQGLQQAVSDWDVLSRSAGCYYGLQFDPKNQAIAAAPSAADCGGEIVWDDSAVTATTPDAVVLVTDRSGSMATHVDAPFDLGPGTGETRLAFAKAAARDFLNLSVGRLGGALTTAGFVSFAETETEDQSIATVITSGTPAAGQVLLNDLFTKINALSPDGATAIGRGLSRAGQMLGAAPAAKAKTILLLSDGENNRPIPVGALDPLVVADDLAKQGIRVFTVPTGAAADKKLLAEIAARTGGALFNSPGSDDLPQSYGEAFALANGASLALETTSLGVEGTEQCNTGEFRCPPGYDTFDTPFGCRCHNLSSSLPPSVSVPISVEANAQQLRVLLSVRNAVVNTWNPRFRLVDPAGTVQLDDTSPGVVSDPFYRILSVQNPAAGTWQLQLSARSSTDQFQYVQAQITNPAPDCYVRVSPAVPSPTTPVRVSVQAYFNGRAIESPQVSATLTRPDGSKVPLTLADAGPYGERSTLLPPSTLVGRGLYDVRVRCAVPDNAPLALGEQEQGPAPGEELSGVVGFARSARTSFFFDSSAQPPNLPGGDCDRNGIPDAQESLTDIDGDGLADVCDQDDDNDDDPDLTDPAPRDSHCSSAGCALANAGPDQILECHNGTATAQLDGSGSRGAAGQPLTFAWTAPVALQNANQPVASGVFPLGTTIATLKVSDSTSSATDAALVTVLDTAPPLLTVPADKTATDCGPVALGTATATDDCGGTVTIVNDAPASFAVGTTTVTWRAIDRFGNVAVKTQRVTVTDLTPPVLTAPVDATAETCGAVAIGTATAVDACGGTVNITSNAPATFVAGTTTVTWRAVDRFNNAITMVQLVQVGVGNNRNCCPAGSRILVGTSNNDTLTGTAGVDCIIGLGGQDTISGLGGNDFLSGGDGDDIISAGDGADFVQGGSGQDTLRGESGNDVLLGFAGDDKCFGGIGDDRLYGGSGKDALNGEDGTDALFGEAEDDILNGGPGNDLLVGGALHDVCTAGGGTDTFLTCEQQQ